MPKMLVDGYLSRLVQEGIAKDALVIRLRSKAGEVWALRQPHKDDIELGPSFLAAKASVNALLNSVKGRA